MTAGRLVSRSTLLVVGCVVAPLATAAFTAGSAEAFVARDADLARLLRLMAALKGVLLALVVAALGWRLRRPAPLARLTGYLALSWVAAGALAAMWQGAGLATAAVLLHVAGAALIVLAWRDPDFIPAAGLAGGTTGRGASHGP